MTLQEKQKRLEQLTKARRNCRECSSLCSKTDVVLFNSAEDSRLDFDTIGPWTRWNGNLNAKVMIVGQDWGTKEYLKEFKKWQEKHNNLPYEDYNKTNNNLASCIKQLNKEWDILNPIGIEDNSRYPLYFTNEILCYKDEKYMSASIPSVFYRECSQLFLLEQIEIVEPQEVILLGSDTFKNFIMATDKVSFNFNIKSDMNFGEIVEQVLADKLQIFYTTRNGKNIRIFPMWHTGGFGARNAKVLYKKINGDTNKSALEILEGQWNKIKNLMK